MHEISTVPFCIAAPQVHARAQRRRPLRDIQYTVYRIIPRSSRSIRRRCAASRAWRVARSTRVAAARSAMRAVAALVTAVSLCSVEVAAEKPSILFILADVCHESLIHCCCRHHTVQLDFAACTAAEYTEGVVACVPPGLGLQRNGLYERDTRAHLTKSRRTGQERRHHSQELLVRLRAMVASPSGCPLACAALCSTNRPSEFLCCGQCLPHLFPDQICPHDWALHDSTRHAIQCYLLGYSVSVPALLSSGCNLAPTRVSQMSLRWGVPINETFLPENLKAAGCASPQS